MSKKIFVLAAWVMALMPICPAAAHTDDPAMADPDCGSSPAQTGLLCVSHFVEGDAAAPAQFQGTGGVGLVLRLVARLHGELVTRPFASLRRATKTALALC